MLQDPYVCVPIRTKVQFVLFYFIHFQKSEILLFAQRSAKSDRCLIFCGVAIAILGVERGDRSKTQT
ncbi:hypothetical protein [Pseudanabaena sp. ABRG5-3]|uniref:hypothetical protein n=1 Tax=Pseudanabaena sp. ABRG5-3 TaxID=685565 RepID=UPI000F82C099|nr:hypothetical protein [Pseudanabaena sp. ABRG5-3]